LKKKSDLGGKKWQQTKIVANGNAMWTRRNIQESTVWEGGGAMGLKGGKGKGAKQSTALQKKLVNILSK